MTKHLVAVALSPEIIGVAGTDLHFGQYALRNTPGTRVPGTSSHPGAFLSELRDFVKRVIQSRKYQYIAMSSSEYGINTKNFFKHIEPPMSKHRAQLTYELFLLFR